ncbi:hypothetical protein BDV93DRAFT_610027 [Ceratobasidium sp. AG-I]|nr:hypothetical protein BDV93DRAFT_610027 [Ceratobasidium sp. AG-I]
MSQQRHPIWGRTVADYFSSDPANAFFPNGTRAPTSRHVKTVSLPRLQTMIEPSHHTVSDLENILSLLRHPSELRYLDNTMLLTRCMDAMRNITGQLDPDGQKLFSYELGFLSFRVAILLIQVGILTHTGTFNAFVRKTSNVTDPHEVSAALAAFVTQLVHESMEKEKSRNWLLGILTSQSGGRMFLRTVGGIFDTDVSFLLNAIWRDRKTFFEICIRAPTPGWSFALLILGEHMQWALEEGIEDEDEWSFLQMLCFRYILIAPDDEKFFLSNICFDASSYRLANNDEYYILSSVDMDDARNVLQTYITRMTPSPSIGWFSPDMRVLLIEFIGQDVVLDLVDLMPQFLTVSFSWIWEVLDRGTRAASNLSDSGDLVRYSTHVFDIAKRLYVNANSNGMSTKTISYFTRVLLEFDFVNLVGRLILTPTINGSNASKLEQDVHPGNPHVPDNGTHDWNHLTKVIGSFSEVYAGSARATNGMLVKLYPDWLKIWNSFMPQFPQHSTRSPWFQEYVQSCEMTWMMLGFAFSYSVQEGRDYRLCNNDRCFGPVRTGYADRTCGRCLLASYCSVLCQNAHWKRTTINGHKEHCLGQEALSSA